jgi:hypothetical protein
MGSARPKALYTNHGVSVQTHQIIRGKEDYQKLNNKAHISKVVFILSRLKFVVDGQDDVLPPIIIRPFHSHI